MQTGARGAAAGRAAAAAAAAAAAEAAAASADRRNAPGTPPTGSDASSASSVPSPPRSGSPFATAAGSAQYTSPRLLLESNNPFYSAGAAARRLERTRAMKRKAADRAAAGLPPTGRGAGRRSGGRSAGRTAGETAGGAAGGLVGRAAGASEGVTAAGPMIVLAGEPVGDAAAFAAAAAAAATAAAGSSGPDAEAATGQMAVVLAARRLSAPGESVGGTSTVGTCGCAAATVDAEKRIIKKLGEMVKTAVDDRKSDEKVNKVMRQEVTAMADEVKSIKRKTGKLVAGLDKAKGDIKRASEGLEALNKTLTVVGPGNGAAGPSLGAAAHVSTAGGNNQLVFFSGPPQKAPWVKQMVVRSRLPRGRFVCLFGCVSLGRSLLRGEMWRLPLMHSLSNAPGFVLALLLCWCADVSSRWQKDIRNEHINNFLAPLYMSDVMPNPEEKRMACASHLHRRFNFPGGVEEAKAKLDTIFLTPRVRKKDEEQLYRPEKLYKVLRQAWPRFQRDLEKVMVPGFMGQAGQWLKIGSRGRVHGRNNMPIFSRAEAKKTICEYWMIDTAMGRNSVLAGLHAGFQRLHAIGIVMVDATPTTERYYKVTFKTYAALLAMVRYCPRLTS